MTDESPWLPAEAQQLWRRWLRLNALLPGALHRELQADAGLSLPDFDVLVQLTDSPEGASPGQRPGARTALGAQPGLPPPHPHGAPRPGRREECRDDGRGAWVVLTEQGRAAIEHAAPAHVATVRRLVFDALTPQEAEVMAEVIEKVLARLEGEPVEEPA